MTDARTSIRDDLAVFDKVKTELNALWQIEQAARELIYASDHTRVGAWGHLEYLLENR